MKKIDGIIAVPGMGQNLTDTVLDDVKNYRGDYMTDIVMIVDESGSLWCMEDEMRECITNFKNELGKFKYADAMRVCVMRFGKEVPKSLKFVKFEDMDTSYRAWQGRTKLYEAICVANNLILQHIDAAEKTNVYVNGIVCVVTDGVDTENGRFFQEAKDAIIKLRSKEIEFQYICIGTDARRCADGLGLRDTEILEVKDTRDGKGLREKFGLVSASAKSASQKAATSSSTSGVSAASKFTIDDD